MTTAQYRVAVLTVSDKASRGERVDTSGPAIREMLEAAGFSVVASAVTPDDPGEIAATLVLWCDGDAVDLALTTGGTGFGPRDNTPEATMRVIERQASGVVEALRAAGREQTPLAALSRGVAGIRRRTLIVNLPGSERAVRENMAALLPMLPHAILMLREGGEHSPA